MMDWNGEYGNYSVSRVTFFSLYWNRHFQILHKVFVKNPSATIADVESGLNVNATGSAPWAAYISAIFQKNSEWH